MIFISCKEELPIEEQNVLLNNQEVTSCIPNSVIHTSCSSQKKNSKSASIIKTCTPDGTNYIASQCLIKSCKAGFVNLNNNCTPQQCSPNQTKSLSCTQESNGSRIASKKIICNAQGNLKSISFCKVYQCKDTHYKQGNFCVPKLCNNSKEIINCTSSIPHAKYATLTRLCQQNGAIQSTGSCIVQSCQAGYIKSGNTCIKKMCEPNTAIKVSCTQAIPNSQSAVAQKQCNLLGNIVKYSACYLISCKAGFNKVGSTCVPQTCKPHEKKQISCIGEIPNSLVATKSQVCQADGRGAKYGSCLLKNCYPGFHTNGNACKLNICTPHQERKISCSASNAKSAHKSLKCNASGSSEVLNRNCIIEKCNQGYLLKENTCQKINCTPNSQINQSCTDEIAYSEIAKKIGTCSPDGKQYNYSNCKLTKCLSGYTAQGNSCILDDATNPEPIDDTPPSDSNGKNISYISYNNKMVVDDFVSIKTNFGWSDCTTNTTSCDVENGSGELKKYCSADGTEEFTDCHAKSCDSGTSLENGACLLDRDISANIPRENLKTETVFHSLSAVTHNGDYIYSSDYSMFSIWEGGDKKYPKMISSINVLAGNDSSRILIHNNNAYVANETKLTIIDVLNKHNPTKISHGYSNMGNTPHPVSAIDIAIHNNNLVLTAYRQGIYIFDISNPKELRLKKYVPTIGSLVQKLAVIGNQIIVNFPIHYIDRRIFEGIGLISFTSSNTPEFQYIDLGIRTQSMHVTGNRFFSVTDGQETRHYDGIDIKNLKQITVPGYDNFNVIEKNNTLVGIKFKNPISGMGIESNTINGRFCRSVQTNQKSGIFHSAECFKLNSLSNNSEATNKLFPLNDQGMFYVKERLVVNNRSSFRIDNGLPIADNISDSALIPFFNQNQANTNFAFIENNYVYTLNNISNITNIIPYPISISKSHQDFRLQFSKLTEDFLVYSEISNSKSSTGDKDSKIGLTIQEFNNGVLGSSKFIPGDFYRPKYRDGFIYSMNTFSRATRNRAAKDHNPDPRFKIVSVKDKNNPKIITSFNLDEFEKLLRENIDLDLSDFEKQLFKDEGYIHKITDFTVKGNNVILIISKFKPYGTNTNRDYTYIVSVDILNKGNPIVKNIIKSKFATTGILIDYGNTLILEKDGGDQHQIIDTSNLERLRFISSPISKCWPPVFTKVENYLYIACTNQAVRIKKLK